MLSRIMVFMKSLQAESVLGLIALLSLSGCATKPITPQDDLDKKFEQQMKGVTLIGRSSRQNSDKISSEEKYLIKGVSKLTGETWLFRSRFQYAGKDIPLPVPVTIKWAGDTPVITLDNLSIPGMGSFSVRIVLDRDQYAGTWSSEKGGGQMFGKIVRGQ